MTLTPNLLLVLPFGARREPGQRGPHAHHYLKNSRSSREHLIEGEAEGRFAILVLLIIVVGDLTWRFLA
jgi:hypothetical protein